MEERLGEARGVEGLTVEKMRGRGTAGDDGGGDTARDVDDQSG